MILSLGTTWLKIRFIRMTMEHTFLPGKFLEHTFLPGKFLDFIKNVVFEEIYILVKI